MRQDWSGQAEPANTDRKADRIRLSYWEEYCGLFSDCGSIPANRCGF